MIPISTFKHIKPEVEIGTTNLLSYAIHFELMHSHPYYFLFTQFFYNFNPYSSNLILNGFFLVY